MKKILLIILLVGINFMQAQSSDDELIANSISKFFEGFHARDSMVMKSMAADEVIMQTLVPDREGGHMIRTNLFSNFLKAISSIPDSVNFQEKILDIKVRTDGPMANAWTPYQFWVNGNLSHCGVNSFQLIKKGGDWKIFYIVDTRRRDDCLEE